jgi:parallel beta-helix repeat protein
LGRGVRVSRKPVSAIMLTLLFIGMLTLASKTQLVKAEPGLLYVNDNISRSSFERWTTPTVKSYLKNGLNTRLMDDSQLPFEVGGKWGFDTRAKWGDTVFVNDDSAELVIGLSDMRPNSYSELVDIIVSCGGEVVNTVAVNGKINAVIADIPLVARSNFVSEVEIRELPRYIEPNVMFCVDFVPNDPDWQKQWGPQKIEANWAWNTTKGDPSILVAVIDTGIDWNHPDLAANYVPLGYDWVNDDPNPMDDSGHGTHCAGIIAAVLNNSIGIAGLAQVRIMAEKAFNARGSGDDVDCAKAIVHAVDQGADVLSLSWGGYGESTLIHEAVEYAYDHGVLVIAAAGNDITECKHYPAGYEEVVAVTATDESDNPASFTNFGDWVEVAAPGVDIYSTMPTYHVTLNNGGVPMNYGYLSGTSMACPHVAGVAALIWSQFPNMTRDQVRAQMRYTTDDLGNPGFDEYYGYGRINARAAVEQVMPEHDVVLLDWNVPCVLRPLDTVTINSTLLNFGASNQSAVTMQLLVNGSVVDSKFIDHLASGASTMVSWLWSPAVEGKHNVTLYVGPVDGETSTENNILSRHVTVKFSETIMVPNDFPRIQKAINEVSTGYTIQVAPGTYREHLRIDESIALIGEDRNTTIIDGDGIGVVVIMAAEQGNMSFSGFTVQNSGYGGGIFMSCSNNVVVGNTIRKNNGDFGLLLDSCSDNTILDNTISDNYGSGVWLLNSGGNILRNNRLIGNTWNFEVEGENVSHYVQDIDTSNTVDEKPIYYWVNQHDKMISADAGYVAAINSTKITVKNLNLTCARNGQGVLFAYTTNSTIANSYISENVVGINLRESSDNMISGNTAVHNIVNIWLYHHCNGNIVDGNSASKGIAGITLSEESSNNIVINNTVSENTMILGIGILLESSSGDNVIAGNNIRSNAYGISMVPPLHPCNTNTIYHNNFINNTNRVMFIGSHINAWDNGYPSGGNYWSDYAGVDLFSGPYQNLTGSDGIGDTPNPIDENNVDHYPLMNSWTPPLPGDIDRDGKVDIKDVAVAAMAFGSYPGDPRWNPMADENEDGQIDVKDIALVAKNFGKTNS